MLLQGRRPEQGVSLMQKTRADGGLGYKGVTRAGTLLSSGWSSRGSKMKGQCLPTGLVGAGSGDNTVLVCAWSMWSLSDPNGSCGDSN